MNVKSYFNKTSLMFGFWGSLGAFIPELLHEFIFRNDNTAGFLYSFFSVSLWIGLIATGISISLLFKTYKSTNRKLTLSTSFVFIIIKQIAIGALLGGIAQIIYALINSFSGEFGRVLCWGIAGGGLGFSISKIIPNYPVNKGKYAGFIGGIIGGIFFSFLAFQVSSILGRLIGASIIGFFIGLFIAVFEQIYREAWVTMKWSEKEFSNISLGEKPIYIGSESKADIYLPAEKNYPATTAIITFINNKVIIDDRLSGKKTELRNGSRINLGFVELIINTKS
jgi:Ca-activated chloride channel family protein